MRFTFFKILILLALACLSQAVSRAQTPARYSLAGENSASAGKHDISNDKYNFKVGPVLIRVSSGGNIEFNDNINIAERGRQADVILRPKVNFDGKWQVTDLNVLSLNLDIEYQKYLSHSQYDARYPIVSPNSAIGFNMYVSDFKINFHDSFSYQENPITQVQVANTARYGRFSNSVGVAVDWDLNDVVLSGGYDYGTFLSSTKQFSYLDSDSHTLNGKATFIVNPTTKVGMSANMVYTSFDQRVQNNGFILTTGPFVDVQITQYMSLTSSIGAQVGDFDKGGSNGDTSNLTNFYGDVSLNHRLNQYVSHMLSIGRTSSVGVNSNFATINYVRHNTFLNLVKDVSLGTELFYEMGEESGGALDESFSRYGCGLLVGYKLSSQLDMSAHYRYIQRESNRSLRDYYQNSLGVSFNYQF